MTGQRHYIGLLGLVVCFVIAPAFANGQTNKKLSLPELVLGTGESNRKVNDSTFVVTIESKSKKLVPVIVGQAKDDLIILVELAKGSDYKISLELAEGLLKMQSKIDWVRVEMSDKGDLQLFIHADARVIGQEAFNERLGQIVIATEMAEKIIGPHLKKNN